MNALIPVNYDNPERPTVSGRELHEFLGVDSNYTTWFKRMCEYGFTEGADFEAIFQKWNTAQGNETTRVNHQLTIPMAKELCMIQRNERGRQFKIALKLWTKMSQTYKLLFGNQHLMMAVY